MPQSQPAEEQECNFDYSVTSLSLAHKKKYFQHYIEMNLPPCSNSETTLNPFTLTRGMFEQPRRFPLHGYYHSPVTQEQCPCRYPPLNYHWSFLLRRRPSRKTHDDPHSGNQIPLGSSRYAGKTRITSHAHYRGY